MMKKIPMRRLHSPLLLLAVLTACHRSAPAKVDLATMSGVDGAGAGPSTRAAPTTSPGANSGKGDSSLNDNGPNAGGQIH